MGSFAYASKILLVVVILVSLKLNNRFEISGVLSGAHIQKSRSSGIVMLAWKYGILDKKNWLGIS